VSFVAQGWSSEAVPAFGAEGTGGCTSARRPGILRPGPAAARARCPEKRDATGARS
jgi:hypothetical protein